MREHFLQQCCRHSYGNGGVGIIHGSPPVNHGIPSHLNLSYLLPQRLSRIRPLENLEVNPSEPSQNLCQDHLESVHACVLGGEVRNERRQPFRVDKAKDNRLQQNRLDRKLRGSYAEYQGRLGEGR